MEAETQSPPIATLSGAAAKLWLYLMVTGGENESNAALMRGAGIKDRHTLVGAKQSLVSLGVWNIHTGCVKNPHTTLVEKPPQGGKSTQPLCEFSTTPSVDYPPPRVEKPPQSVADMVEKPHTPARVPDEGEFLGQNDESALAACASADRLPRDGDEKRPTSNFQARRRAQIAALQRASSELFGQTLQDAAAKDLLRLGQDSAEVVLGALEKSVGKEYPLGYAKAILRRETEQRKTVPQEDEGATLRAYTEQDRATGQRLAARLRRSGKASLLDEGGEE